MLLGSGGTGRLTVFTSQLISLNMAATSYRGLLSLAKQASKSGQFAFS